MSELEKQQNPFVGLRPFESEDSLYFFGRDTQVKALLQRLYSERFLAVIGSSGSGKSSLIRAGLIPNLEAGFLVQDRDSWIIAMMKPGDTPLHNLAYALLQAMDADITAAAEFTEQIRESGIQAVFDSLKSVMASGHTNLLLLVDQFEEIFRFGLDRNDGRIHVHPETAAFVSLMLRLSEQEELHIYVCLTMRSDFLGECDEFYRLPEAMNRSQYLVPRLTRDQRRAAIAGPIRLARAKITDRLLDRLLNENVNSRDDLPILQHVLMRTWDNWADNITDAIDNQHYENVRTIKQALNYHAEEALAELTGQQPDIARRIFQALTETDASNRRIRRPAHLSEIAKITGNTAKEVMQVIARFREQKRSFLVLSSEKQEDDPLINISHESLIRQWHQLTKWVDEEAVSAKIFRRLAETAELFSGKDEVYHGAELDRALEWQTQQSPTSEWAARYHGFYGQAMLFLSRSRKQRDNEKQEKEQRLEERNKLLLEKNQLAKQKNIEQRKILRMTRFIAIFVSIFLFITLSLGLNNYALRIDAEKLRTKAKDKPDFAYKNAMKANYKLAKDFENKAHQELKHAMGNNGKSRDFQKALLYATAALAQPTTDDDRVLTNGSVNKFFNPSVAQQLFTQRWFSPSLSMKFVSTSTTFSPDGTTLVSGSRDKTVRLWDVASGKQTQQLDGHTASVSSVDFSPDGKSLVSGSWDKSVRLWNVASGKEIKRLDGHTDVITSVAFSPDGKSLVSGSGDKTIRLWNIDSLKQIQQLDGHTDSITSVAFSPDGKTLASGSWDKSVRLWDIASGKQIKKLDGHTDVITSVAFSPDGKSLVSGSGDKTVRLWDIASGKQIQKLDGHTASVVSVAFSPGGKSLASGSLDKTVRLWDVASGKQIQQLDGHTASVISVAFSPDGKSLVSGSLDKTVRLWDIVSGKQIQQLDGHTASVISVAFSPDGKSLASGSLDKTIRLWDILSGKQIQQLDGHAASVTSVAFSPDGKSLASGSLDKTVRLWDIVSGKQIQQLDGHTASAISVAFSPDGKNLASGSLDKTVRLWDIISGKQIQQLDGHAASVTSVAFSPDGKSLASGSGDKTVRLWDIVSGKQTRQLDGHTASVTSVAFSPDGKSLASGSGDKTVRLWVIVSGKQTRQLDGHTEGVTSVAFSPDGKSLVSGAGDKTVRLWDIASGKQTQQLDGHTDGITSVAFSPDGTNLASGSGDKTARLWDIASISSVASIPDSTTLVSGAPSKTVRLWNTRAFDLFLDDGKATEVLLNFSQAGEFLWQLQLDGLYIKPNPHPPTLKPQDGYYFSYAKKFRPLLNPPSADQSKFDQVLEWAIQQAENK